MNDVELILALLVVVVALALLSQRLRIQYPIALVLGGLVLALLPGTPEVALEPDLVFLLFLPPLLYIAAFSTSIRDVHALIRPILLLAVGLVLVTTFAIAAVLHALEPELDWAVCIAFGAIVSPPDAVAASAVLRRLGVSRKLLTLLEGESLFNDATALVAYSLAIAAVTTASFSAAEAGYEAVVVSVGGVLVGLAVARLVYWLRRPIHDPPVEIALSLLTPFAAYLPAEAIGVSGVLSTVTAGLLLGWWAPQIMDAETRVRGRAVWEMMVFLLNGLVFILIGLQLSSVLPAPPGRSLASVVVLGIVISTTLIGVRIVYLALYTWALSWTRRRSGGASKTPREILLVSWAGMRGVVSLAVALALPFATPERDFLILLTFVVILITLVGPGLTLPWLVNRLGIVSDADLLAHGEVHAREAASEAAARLIDELAREWPDHLPLFETLRVTYQHRSSHMQPHDHEAYTAADPTSAAGREEEEHRVIRRQVIDAEREVLLDLRARGDLDFEAWRGLERELDLEELRMDS